MSQQPVPSSVDPIDLESWSSKGEGAPQGRRYRIRIDREYFVVEVPRMVAADILMLAGKSAATHRLYQKHRGQEPKQLQPTIMVDFTQPGIERFQTIPIDPTDGLEMRRDFRLLAEDVQALEERGLAHETIVVGTERWLLMHGFKLPPGYKSSTVTAAVLLATSYPDSQIDMVYFSPPLLRADDRGIASVTPRKVNGLDFQQWSRHRTPANPWRIGIDNLGTHLLMVNHWLEKELTR